MEMQTSDATPPSGIDTSSAEGESLPLRINRTPTGVQAKEALGQTDLDDPALYFNRELSHLQFNIRVLEQALDDAHPLLNRLMFLLIFSSNMDEFFEIRVAGLKHQVALNDNAASADGRLPKAVLAEISDTAHRQIRRQYQILNNTLLPALEAQGLRFRRRDQWCDEQRAWVRAFFDREIMPVISPIGLDPSHPFPRLVNKSLNFIVELEGKDAFGRAGGMAILPAPRSLPRLIALPKELCSEGFSEYVFLSSMIHAHADELFPGMRVLGCYQFRLTRNADLSVDPEEVSDLASALRGELLARRYGSGVRLEVANNCPEGLTGFLLRQFDLTEDDLYRVEGPVNLTRMMSVLGDVDRPELVYRPFTPSIPKGLKEGSLFSAIRQQDILLHHPFQAFSPIEDLLREAARDPDVLAIKQTLYRTGADSSIVGALVEAASQGKEVTVVIELRARFDEADNLQLASRLQEAGAIVIYGIMAYKTHAKMIHIVRREGGELRHYAHLGTGNYHAKTARLYTDYSLMTANQALCADVHRVFQQLSGMGQTRKIDTLLHAPFTLHARLIEMIDREAQFAARGKRGHIIIKCNSLTEPKLIKALYRASQAGVECDLIIRGMCSLRPGVKGVSENIRVRSIIGRFLEHTRVFHFHNGGKPETWCASADFMTRNMFHRVETCFLLKDKKLANRVRKDLETYLVDNCQSWILESDGSYHLQSPGKSDPISAQETLLYAYASKS
ncbi:MULTISPECIES: polyphosphate kinase 1 [unclassified Halomonas]|uniref:polyphosphate kinase 1 n=1 Tax=unclassified Halomonas TaxID=2609666 RepID=UPI0021E3ED5E|nr:MULTISPECIES: polyphosphate kinase 1 [unclassified Halomonas]UYG00487.1 polyphosphate kinase 1 [Halomonas sp. GD1P12]WNL38438.1 polyphosphate kinase 1 [Halomonas sp. PAMB 3232]WNL41738.1 polyphosphate kinase 1 [Halomonas sp. PAMB 3264]